MPILVSYIAFMLFFRLDIDIGFNPIIKGRPNLIYQPKLPPYSEGINMYKQNTYNNRIGNYGMRIRRLFLGGLLGVTMLASAGCISNSSSIITPPEATPGESLAVEILPLGVDSNCFGLESTYMCTLAIAGNDINGETWLGVTRPIDDMNKITQLAALVDKEINDNDRETLELVVKDGYITSILIEGTEYSP